MAGGAGSTTRWTSFKGRSAKSIDTASIERTDGSKRAGSFLQIGATNRISLLEQGAIMRTSELKQSILSILRITAVIGCLSLSALAQTSSPTPSPAPTGPAGSSLPQL